MIDSYIIFLVSIVLILIFIILLILVKKKDEMIIAGLTKEIAILNNNKATLQNEFEETQRLFFLKQEENTKLKIQNSNLDAQNIAQKEKYQDMIINLEAQKKHLRDEVSNAMQKILDSKIQIFDEKSSKSLEQLLKPFRENIDLFSKKIEENQLESIKNMAALSKEIEMVAKAGFHISQETQNLTKALKSEKQAQGRWGEMVLESVLEHSGLIKNIHYLIQESYRGDDGGQKRPDVIVKLPQDRAIIIDSKVSLVDYDSLIRSTTPEERIVAQKAIAISFKQHIDILSSKDYSHYTSGTLQYIFMFIPIEGAYSIALEQDPSLYEYALKKHVIIVYPTTLVVTLKTIYLYWQREKADEKIEHIFVEAGKLYDKVAIFGEEFTRMGNQIQTLTKTFDKASNQLSGGSGNIIKRVENLKILGAKTTRTLKAIKVSSQSIDEDEIFVELLQEESEDAES